MNSLSKYILEKLKINKDSSDKLTGDPKLFLSSFDSTREYDGLNTIENWFKENNIKDNFAVYCTKTNDTVFKNTIYSKELKFKNAKFYNDISYDTMLRIANGIFGNLDSIDEKTLIYTNKKEGNDECKIWANGDKGLLLNIHRCEIIILKRVN